MRTLATTGFFAETGRHLARKLRIAQDAPVFKGFCGYARGKEWAFPGRQKGPGNSGTLLFCASQPASGREVFEFPHWLFLLILRWQVIKTLFYKFYKSLVVLISGKAQGFLQVTPGLR